MNVSTKTLSVFRRNNDQHNTNAEAALEKTAEIQFSKPQNLLELLNAHNIGINQSCGGFGSCTTCRIYVTHNVESLLPRNEIERERAQERNFLAHERLACQIEIQDTISIEISNELIED